MITYEEALEEALEFAKEHNVELKEVEETTDAYIFGDPDYVGFGGYIPIVVAKEDGAIMAMHVYIDEYDGEHVDEWKL